MAFTAPFTLQNVPVNADVVREAISSFLPSTGGIVNTGDLAVTQTSTASMAVLIGVGRVWIPGNNIINVSGTTYSKQGQYFILNDAPITASIATADGTNPRVDTVYVAVQDSAYAGSTNGVSPVYVLTGTPSASPVAPTAPYNSITLATVAVAANATSITTANITANATLAVISPVVANLSQPVTQQPIIKAATVASLTTNASGDGTITLPTAFPNALTSASLTDSSNPSNLGAMSIKWTSSSSNKANITFRVYGSNGAALTNLTPSNGLVLSYVATGY